MDAPTASGLARQSGRRLMPGRDAPRWGLLAGRLVPGLLEGTQDKGLRHEVQEALDSVDDMAHT